MPNRGLKDVLDIQQTLAPDVRTTNNTTVVGATVDLQGYDAATFELNMGDWADTGTDGLEFFVQATNDTTSWADALDSELSDSVASSTTVSGAPSTGCFAKIDAADEDNKVYTCDYIGDKRYVRAVVAAQENQSTGYDAAVNVILGNPMVAPTTNN